MIWSAVTNDAPTDGVPELAVLVSNLSVTGTSFTPSTALTPGHGYAWSVTAVSAGAKPLQVASALQAGASSISISESAR